MLKEKNDVNARVLKGLNNESDLRVAERYDIFNTDGNNYDKSSYAGN